MNDEGRDKVSEAIQLHKNLRDEAISKQNFDLAIVHRTAVEALEGKPVPAVQIKNTRASDQSPPNQVGLVQDIGVLTRYGIEWRGPHEPIAVRKDDGYWTPWHVAQEFLNLTMKSNNGTRPFGHLHQRILAVLKDYAGPLYMGTDDWAVDKILAITEPQWDHDYTSEKLAWEALGRPDGTYTTSNVERLCEAYAKLKNDQMPKSDNDDELKTFNSLRQQIQDVIRQTTRVDECADKILALPMVGGWNTAAKLKNDHGAQQVEEATDTQRPAPCQAAPVAASAQGQEGGTRHEPDGRDQLKAENGKLRRLIREKSSLILRQKTTVTMLAEVVTDLLTKIRENNEQKIQDEERDK